MRSGKTDDPGREEQGEQDGWSRRGMMSLIGAGALLPSLSACLAPQARRKAPELAADLHDSSVTALAAAVKAKRVSASELVHHFLDRVELVNPDLNAVVQLCADRALAEAKKADAAVASGSELGPLHGVPMTIKDSFDTEGVVSTGGTLGRRSYIPDRDATVVARLRRAGAILLGKTNTPELTLSYETNNRIYGRTNNPYDLERTPGGSSGGASAILAAGASPFDIGSDYGGSVRLPSHFCGTAGIKPTSGRVPRTGHIIPAGGMLDAFQQIGPMTRRADDLHLLLSVIAGPDGIDPAIVPAPLGHPDDVDLTSLRVLFHNSNGILEPTDRTSATVLAAARSLESTVGEIREGRPPGIEESFDLCTALWAADGGALTRRLLGEYRTTDSSLAERDSEPLGAEELDALIHRWDTFRRSMLAVFETSDVLLGPVHAYPALPHRTSAENFSGFSYTTTHNLTGWPGAVVRCGTSPEGLPIGVQVVAAPWREDVALAVAMHLEDSLGGFQAPSS